MARDDDPLHAAEQLCARMVHGLGSGIGVLGNLLELALEASPRPPEVLVLAGETAGRLTRQVASMRAAWGPTADPLDLGGVRELAAGLIQDRCTIALDGMPPDTVFTPEAARMVLNLLLLAADGLPVGGEIALSGTADDLVVTIAGPRAAWPPRLAACLVNPEEAWRALAELRRWQMGLTVLLAPRLGFRLALLMQGRPDAAPPLRLSAL